MSRFLGEDAEFIWACGLFEGEGTCGVFNNGTSVTGKQLRTVHIQLVMADLDVVDRFHRAIGFGVVEGPFNYKSSRKPLYRWRARGSRAQKSELMARMLPWLGKRRQAQAQAVIDYEFEPDGRNHSYYGKPRLIDREACVRGHKVTKDSVRTNKKGSMVCVWCSREDSAKHRAKLREKGSD